ncbi:molybdopterin-dependent oxidoreductase [Desulfitobacterium sp. PCE1]|uniref:molybdopterin-dependent oxidoreductase n=1 Tax=Desulfitobacterium sp. PCE1 TaxID=146907 RepID=UPI0003777E80|nr:molybdopterin-dependent oxidoreductase [Desulfitobacterium sp. PCE1]
MSERKAVPTNCRFCGYQCGLTATVEEGRVIKVQPDSSRFPNNAEILRGCKRWPMIMEVLDHPKRINYPLKRVGERGSGQWEQISWEQALDEISLKLQSLKEQYGPEVLATSIGGPHTTFWPLHRFLSLFGSPNNMGIGQICWNPGIWVNTLTYGWPVDMELDPGLTECAILWGVNPSHSDNSLFWHTVKEFSRRGKPLIVIDPRYTETAAQGTLWLPLRPGTDAVLALGLLHVIVQEKLYDEDFVNNWCYGFKELEEHLTAYNPTYVEEITGVKAEDVSKAARLYAQSTPACLYSGRGIDQLGLNSFPAHRALAILRAITGNLDLPGASHLSEMPDFYPELDLELSESFTTTDPRSVNQEQLKLQSYGGYGKVREYTMKHNKRLPMRYMTSAHPNRVWKAMLTGEPYPIRSMIVMASNPLLTQGDTYLVYQALKSLDLLVVLELFETPTSMLADYILPSAGVLERPLLETKAGVANIAYGGDQAVEPYYERKPDYYFWRELGLRLDQGKDWPWETYREALEYSLSPLGITWEEFCQTGLYCTENNYFKFLEQDQGGNPQGFATRSGKVEIYSELLKELDEDPLPKPRSFPQVNKEYPLLMMTGARFQPYYASSYHQLDRFRRMHPEPIVEMSPETGRKLGLEEGCFVYVETERGKARFMTRFIPMCDDAVSVEYGWWYPEAKAAEPELGGVWLSNVNLLTSGDFETSDPLIGTWTYNGSACRVRKEK